MSLRKVFTRFDVNPQKKKAWRRKIVRGAILLGRAIAIAVVCSVILVFCLRWVPLPTSAFMIERRIEMLFEKAPHDLRYQWIPIEAMSPQMPLAVVAAEDQKFPDHWGFDFGSISQAVENNENGGRLRGASTITQQVAKNLFLWSGRSYVRKGMEAYLTILLEALWSKHRILEVYLNIAEFGDGVYGVSAAAETLLGKKPSKLTKGDAALLAAVLPNPRRRDVKHPSRPVMQRRQWIERQMRQLGGTAYVRDL